MGLAMQPFQLVVILVIVVLIFGTKRLKEVGGDVGSAIKSFKKAMSTSENEEDPPRDQKQLSGTPGQPTEKREQSEHHQS